MKPVFSRYPISLGLAVVVSVLGWLTSSTNDTLQSSGGVTPILGMIVGVLLLACAISAVVGLVLAVMKKRSALLAVSDLAALVVVIVVVIEALNQLNHMFDNYF